MTTTTSYGTWVNHGDGTHLTVEDTVEAVLGEYVDDFDVDAVVDAYRQAINDALSDGVSLHGDEFYGPHPREDVDIAEAIRSIDVLEIAYWHELSERDKHARQLDKLRAAKEALPDAVRAAVAAGVSEVQAAEHAGVTRMTVRKWLGKS